MTEVDSQKRGGREREQEGEEEKGYLFLGKMSGRFRHVLVESKVFKMERGFWVAIGVR